jgi:hypothetical protein
MFASTNGSKTMAIDRYSRENNMIERFIGGRRDTLSAERYG